MPDRTKISETISEQMIQLQAKYYDRPPEAAHTYYTEDLVLVRLKEVFSKAEAALIAHGDVIAVQHIRRRFQQKMAEDFKGVVEQATGRQVLNFLSETNVDTNTSVEVFFLGADMEDMSAFEVAADDQQSQQ